MLEHQIQLQDVHLLSFPLPLGNDARLWRKEDRSFFFPPKLSGALIPVTEPNHSDNLIRVALACVRDVNIFSIWTSAEL